MTITNPDKSAAVSVVLQSYAELVNASNPGAAEPVKETTEGKGEIITAIVIHLVLSGTEQLLKAAVRRHRDHLKDKDVIEIDGKALRLVDIEKAEGFGSLADQQDGKH